MSDPKVIYLGPECEDEFCDGRTWADHVAWPDCDCKHKPVRYNIGSDYDAALAREAALRDELNQCGSMAAMVEEKEWAEHVGTGPISSRIESSFTRLHNELSGLRESYDSMRDRKNSIVDLQQRLTDAENYISHTHKKIDTVIGMVDDENLIEIMRFIKGVVALKPAEEGEGS